MKKIFRFLASLFGIKKKVNQSITDKEDISKSDDRLGAFMSEIKDSIDIINASDTEFMKTVLESLGKQIKGIAPKYVIDNINSRLEKFFKKEIPATVATNAIRAFAKNNKYDLTNLSLPILAGKKSEVSYLDGYTITNPFVAYFERLEQNAIINPDISNAVLQDILLSNTSLTYTFDESVPKRALKNMNTALKKFFDSVYMGRGIRAFMADSAYDLSVFGALSNEAEINDPPMDGIKELWRVKNRTIRWVLKNGEWKVCQLSPRTGRLIELNPLTYIYNPILSNSEVPYGIPPLLPSIKMEEIESIMLDSFVGVMKRYGVLGLVTALLSVEPEREEEETDEEYLKKVNKLMEETANQIEKNWATGIMVGLEGMHEFNLTGNNVNASGLDSLFNVLDTRLAASLKTFPSMIGRPFTVAETFGRIILEVTTGKLETIQDKLAKMVEKFAKLQLRLLGFPPQYWSTLKVELKKATIRDEFRTAQTRRTNVETDIMLRDNMVINNDQVAQQQGYDSAVDPNFVNNPDSATTQPDDGTGTDM